MIPIEEDDSRFNDWLECCQDLLDEKDREEDMDRSIWRTLYDLGETPQRAVKEVLDE